MPLFYIHLLHYTHALYIKQYTETLPNFFFTIKCKLFIIIETKTTEKHTCKMILEMFFPLAHFILSNVQNRTQYLECYEQNYL